MIIAACLTWPLVVALGASVFLWIACLIALAIWLDDVFSL